MATSVATAAALLQCPVSEILQVVDVANGYKVQTTDGQWYINITSGADSQGKSGLMFFTSPVASYAGNFPVYAPFFPGVEPSDADTSLPQDLPLVRGTP
jgi:hypothetical protein